MKIAWENFNKHTNDPIYFACIINEGILQE